MRFEEITFTDRQGSNVIFRNAVESDAEALLSYLKITNAESPYLICEPEEITMTLEDEKGFIENKINAERDLLLVAYADGKHVGNCSLMSVGGSVRYRHRCSVAIALYKEYCGRGIGRKMLETVLAVAKDTGYEQAELEVITENVNAIALYKSLGFEICGTIPRSTKYKDGSYADSYQMTKML